MNSLPTEIVFQISNYLEISDKMNLHSAISMVIPKEYWKEYYSEQVIKNFGRKHCPKCLKDTISNKPTRCHTCTLYI